LNDQWDRRVKRILLDPRGRDALKKFGIEVDIADQKKEEQKPIVSILCPTYRAPEPQMQDSLGQMVQYTRQKDFAVVYSGPPCSASVVHWSRNWMIAEQLKSGKPWTHILFIDDDIVIEPDTLERLLIHKKDIVAGLCTRRCDPPVPNIRYFDKESGIAKQVWEWPQGQLIDGVYAGTGLMLLSQNALEQIGQAYFDCLWERDFYGLSDERINKMREVRMAKFDKEKMAYWFRFLPNVAGDEMGEDMSFCHIAKHYCGLEIYVDTSIMPGHLGSYPFSIRDFMPYRDQCVAMSKEQGTYKEQSRILTAEPINSFHVTYEAENA